MATERKQSFLGGAAILAGAAAVVKLIGAVYKIPLNNILGEVGKTYFNTAYYIYNVLLTISTAGLPLAISRLTSQAHAQGRENQKRKLFKTALLLFFSLGLAGSVFMFSQAGSLAVFMNNSMARLPIRALSPAVFCVCLLACMRGYTQGQGNMTPTADVQGLYRSPLRVVRHPSWPGTGRGRGGRDFGRHRGDNPLHVLPDSIPSAPLGPLPFL